MMKTKYINAKTKVPSCAHYYYAIQIFTTDIKNIAYT